MLGVSSLNLYIFQSEYNNYLYELYDDICKSYQAITIHQKKTQMK